MKIKINLVIESFKKPLKLKINMHTCSKKIAYKSSKKLYYNREAPQTGVSKYDDYYFFFKKNHPTRWGGFSKFSSGWKLRHYVWQKQVSRRHDITSATLRYSCLRFYDPNCWVSWIWSCCYLERSSIYIFVLKNKCT